MRRQVIVVALILSFACGCAHNPHGHSGELVAEYRPGKEPEVEHAPYKAAYALYQWPKPPESPPPHTWYPEHHAVEIFVRGLSKSDAVGFEKGEGGNIVAVAGDEKIVLEEGAYCWHITP